MTSAPPKRKREDDNSPSKALNMPGDICKHCNKRCTSKGKSSEAIQCDIVLYGYMPLAKALRRSNLKHFQIFLSHFQILHTVAN